MARCNCSAVIECKVASSFALLANILHIMFSDFLNFVRNVTFLLYRAQEAEQLIHKCTRIWANAQRYGRPAEYTCRWRPLFSATKFGWRPILEFRAVTLPRRETRWNLHGFPKLLDRSQPLVGRSSPYCENMWRRYWCLKIFSRLSIRAFVAKI